MNRAFIFPGQGSQLVGMGKDFFDNFKSAQETFLRVDNTLKRQLSHIIFNGPLSDLTLTVNAQPALMAVSMAIINVLKDQTKQDITTFCSFVAGHSLGEYSALCAVGSISLEDTTRLLHVRSTSMQEACPQDNGTMAACIGIGISKLEEIVKDVSKLGVCQIANDNIIGQIVISGHTKAVEYAVAIVKDLGYKAIMLPVSAPFHCSLMKPAEDKMSLALQEVTIKDSAVPIIQNVTASPIINYKEIKQNLISQICSRVRWRESLEELSKLKVEEIVEIGSGKILTNMIKKTDYPFKLTNISNIAEFDAFLSQM